jgi:hypothetical protein
MIVMKGLKTTTFVSLISITMLLTLSSCTPKEDVKSPSNPTTTEDIPPTLADLPDSLSKLKVYKGNLQDLQYCSYYISCELVNGMFTDSCEKQNLVYVPAGKMIVAPTSGSGLPTFPDGTVFAKTFYYFKDKRNQSLGKIITETRVIYYKDSQWKYKTYAWNDQQTEAVAITGGKAVDVSWIDELGKSHQFQFKIANISQCVQCHLNNTTTEFLPIGFQMKYINGLRKTSPIINQITYLQQQGKMNSVNPSSFDSVPNVDDTSKPLENRVRAYLAINCAHCHSSSGMAWGVSNLDFSYEASLDSTHILTQKTEILNRLTSSQAGYQMPLVHATLIDYQHIALIQQYFATLP